MVAETVNNSPRRPLSAKYGIEGTRKFLETYGASLLRTTQLAAGEAGGDKALRLVRAFQAPDVPRRRDVLRAVQELCMVLEEIPTNVQPQVPVTEEDDVAGLRAAVSWHNSRMYNLIHILA